MSVQRGVCQADGQGASRRARAGGIRWLVVLAVVLGLIGVGAGADPVGAIVGARIVGGAETTVNGFPFQVALYDPRVGSVADGFFCGGVIVDATHVATAAHCLVDQATGRVSPPADVAVLAGTDHLNGLGDPPYGPEVVQDPASVTSFDPSYDPRTNDYDVGVVTLTRPLWSGQAAPSIDGQSSTGSSPAIAPIRISASLAATYANPNSAVGPVLATVSGWGDVRAEPSSSRGEEGSYPRDLRAVQIPLVGDGACSSDYADPFSSQPITARMLCAGSPGGGRDSCFGDSGGPLVVDRQSPADPPNDYVLAGLVSFGEGCAQAGSPGVYARIANPSIARFLTSDPPQTPLDQTSFAHAAGGGGQPRPSLGVVSTRCARARCAVKVLATEPAGGAGVRTVQAMLGFQRRAKCSRPGRRIACLRTIFRTPGVRAMGGRHFLITAEHLRPGHYELTLTAIDQAGLRQTKPTRVALVLH
jgi:hypothetical protein